MKGIFLSSQYDTQILKFLDFKTLHLRPAKRMHLFSIYTHVAMYERRRNAADIRQGVGTPIFSPQTAEHY